MSERGVIQNRNRKRQILDFRDLQYERGITPTDIDMFLDFGGRLFIVIELKYRNAKTLNGQRKALERLVDATTQGGVTSCCIIATHTVDNWEEDVKPGMAEVVEYRYKGEWRIPKKRILVFQAIDKLRKLVFNPL